MQSTKTKIESYPAPTQLADLSPTDLSPQEVKAVTEAVNPLIADAFALYVKTTIIYVLAHSYQRIWYSSFDGSRALYVKTTIIYVLAHSYQRIWYSSFDGTDWAPQQNVAGLRMELALWYFNRWRARF